MATPGQFIEQAMLSGFQQGAQEKDTRKEQEREDKFNDLVSQREALRQKFATTLDANGQWTDATAPLHQEILKNQADIREFFHPDKNPGAIAKFGRKFMEKIHLVKPQIATSESTTFQPKITDAPGADSVTDTMVDVNPSGLVKAGNIPVWNRPIVKNADGTTSSEYSTSFQDQNGNEVLVPTVVDGKFLTPDGKKPPPGSPAEKEMFKRAWQHYLRTGQNLGSFKTPADANAYAEKLHNRGSRPGVLAAGPKVTVTGPAMTPKQREQFKKNNAADQAAVAAWESAAPMSPEQDAAMKRKLAAGDLQADVDAKMALYDKFKPDASPEERQKYFDMISGMAAKNEKPTAVGVPYKSTDGQWYQRFAYPDGSTGNEMIPGYTPPPAKGGTSAFSVGLDSYAKAHGFGSFQDVPDQYKEAVTNYEIRKQALDKAMPTATTTTTLKQDINGMWVPVTETNYRTPGGPIQLIDPLPLLGGGAVSPQSPSAAHGAPGGHPAHGHAPAPTSSGNTHVGAPLFQGRTAAYNKAQSDYTDATKIASLADQVATKPDDAVNQKRLAVMLEKASAGRFTVQALDYVIKAGWGNTLQQWANNPTTGALPADVLRQLVDGAHENLTASKAALDSLVVPNSNQPSSQPPSTPPINLLSKDHVTHFKSGQHWILGANGQPVQTDQSGTPLTR